MFRFLKRVYRIFNDLLNLCTAYLSVFLYNFGAFNTKLMFSSQKWISETEDSKGCVASYPFLEIDRSKVPISGSSSTLAIVIAPDDSRLWFKTWEN